MTMNREQKRAMQKAGQLAEDGTPVSNKNKDRRAASQRNVSGEKTGVRQFVREVRQEMKKVLWPTREETVRFSIIVAIAIFILGAFIFFVDLGAGEFVQFLFPSASSTSVVAPLLLRTITRDRKQLTND